MATKASIRQMRYDKAHQKQYNIKMNQVYDKDIIEKLSSVPSVMGYIKQLIRDDIKRNGSVPKNNSDSVPELFKDPYTDPIAKTVGEWIDKATSVLSDEKPYIVSDSVPKTEGEDKKMKTYRIKPEYLDLWEGGDIPSDPDRVITEDDIRTFSNEWGTSVEELLKQLIPCD